MYSHCSIQELLGKLEELGDQVPWEMAQAILAKEQEAVIPLCDVLQDDDYWEAEDNRHWMRVHAVKLLGMLAASFVNLHGYGTLQHTSAFTYNLSSQAHNGI